MQIYNILFNYVNIHSFFCIFVYMLNSLSIYKASAGSGKTFTLTVRYIWLMIRPGAENEYLHTLAVTFTNKATAEMKDRILEHLYGISHNLKSSDDCLSSVKKMLQTNGDTMTDEDIRHRCGVVLSQILHDYSRFRVETIDSFFQSVLRSLARELGLGANLQVDLGDEEVVSHAVDRLIDTLDTDGKLQKIILSYAREEIENSGRWNISQNLKNFAKCIFGEDFQKRTPEQRALLEDDRSVEKFRSEMRRIEEESRTELQQLCDETLHTMDEALGDTSAMKGVSAPYTFIKYILAGKNPEENKTIQNIKTGNTSEFIKKSNQNDNAVFSRVEKMFGIFNGFLEQYPTILERKNTAQMARKYTHQLQLLGNIWDQILSINEEMESINLASTPTLLSNLVRNQDSPFVFEKIGTVLNNIMIDEFQDTSLQQWNNFRVLLFEDQSQGGHDLIVGDIKQSIYRWRGGDWSLLQNLDTSMASWKPEIIPLNTNWRSERRIINLNNNLFPKAAEAMGISDIYSDVEQLVPEFRETDGYYNISIRNTSDKNNKLNSDELLSWRLDEMLESIRNLRAKGLPFTEMAILVRHNKEASLILDYITQNNHTDIPVASDEAYRLDSSTLVQTIVSAIRYLATDETQDPVPARTFLMYWLQAFDQSKISDDKLLSTPSTKLLPTELTENRQRLLGLSLYEMVEEIYRLLHLERIKGQEAYHFAFLDAINDFLRDNLNDPRSFLEAWDNKISSQCIPCGSSNGVHIYSIHKSKGLEFHTVFIPFADWYIESDTGKDLLWCMAGQEHSEYDCLGRLPIVKNAQMENSFYRERYRREHLESRIDELNALYVAMTRPAKNLYMWIACVPVKNEDPKQFKTTGALLNYCLNPQNEFSDGLFILEEGEPMLTVKQEKQSDNRMNPNRETLQVPMISYSARLNFQQSNEAQQLLQGITQRQEGIIFHNIMSQITSTDDIHAVIERSRMQGVITQEQSQRLTEHLHQIQTNSLIGSWFSVDNHLFNECEILDPKTNRKGKHNQRPDRVVMHGNDITVIDYKFGEEHGAYQGQVHNYMYLLSRIYPHHTIHGYLWYVNSETTEEVAL